MSPLSVLRRLETKARTARRAAFDRYRVDIEKRWAMHQEEVDLAVVSPDDCSLGIALNALRREQDASVPLSTRLALCSDEAISEIDDQVVALVHAERNEYPESTAYEFRENVGLCALTDVDWMSTLVRLGQGKPHAPDHPPPSQTSGLRV